MALFDQEKDLQGFLHMFASFILLYVYTTVQALTATLLVVMYIVFLSCKDLLDQEKYL